MQVLTTIQELKDFKKSLIHQDTLGLVPTMGALHKGHQSLMQKSTQQNTHTIVSIFVNPTQFGPTEDFNKYPRTLEKDCEICQKLGVSAVFAPQITEMYQKEDEITLNPPKSMGYVFEGFVRENHFNGVLQVVLKLFNLIQPHFAYFGQKDAQQLLILKRLVQDMFLPLTIIPCETIRDADGLALSSRNIYLSEEERTIALEIPKALQKMETLFKQGCNSSKELIAQAKTCISHVELDYFTITDYNLHITSTPKHNEAIALIAGKVGKTRLLDNLWF